MEFANATIIYYEKKTLEDLDLEDMKFDHEFFTNRLNLFVSPAMLHLCEENDPATS